jgi:ectoine utilization protein EutC
MIILKEDDIRQHVQINREVIKVVENGFTSLSAGEVELPPIMRVDIPENNGEVDVKTAYIKGLDKFAIKISSGFFNNHRLGLPSGNGMMLLLSTETGVPQSVLLDNGYLTDVRTAAAGAIAAKYLARENIETVGVIGTGSQAKYQMLALKQVRQFNRLIVYGRNPNRTNQYIKEMEPLLNVQINVAQSVEELVKESDVVVTTTPSRTPIIRTEWLHPGLHITAMGSDAEHKQELESGILKQADLLVCDVKSQCFKLGELRHGLEQGLLSNESDIVELGDITSGQTPGRTNDQQVTVCDLTGTGVQDTAIALYAFNELVAKVQGLQIDNN